MEAAAERPSRLSLEMATPLCSSKCVAAHSGPHCFAHSAQSQYVRRNYHHCRTVPIRLHTQPLPVPPTLHPTVTRHPATGYYYHPGIGVCMCNDPSSRLNAHARDVPYGRYTQGLPGLPGRPWPQWDAWVSPYRRGRGKFYGWYYDGPIKEAPDRRHREVPWVERLDSNSRPRDQHLCDSGGSLGYRSRWGFHQP